MESLLGIHGDPNIAILLHRKSPIGSDTSRIDFQFVTKIRIVLIFRYKFVITAICERFARLIFFLLSAIVILHFCLRNSLQPVNNFPVGLTKLFGRFFQIFQQIKNPLDT